MVTDSYVEPRALTLNDRCDRCGAGAKAIAYKEDKELLFCGHHINGYRAVLIGQGFNIFS